MEGGGEAVSGACLKAVRALGIEKKGVRTARRHLENGSGTRGVVRFGLNLVASKCGRRPRRTVNPGLRI